MIIVLNQWWSWCMMLSFPFLRRLLGSISGSPGFFVCPDLDLDLRSSSPASDFSSFSDLWTGFVFCLETDSVLTSLESRGQHSSINSEKNRRLSRNSWKIYLFFQLFSGYKTPIFRSIFIPFWGKLFPHAWREASLVSASVPGATPGSSSVTRLQCPSFQIRGDAAKFRIGSWFILPFIVLE